MNFDSLKEWRVRCSNKKFFLPKFENDPNTEIYYKQIIEFALKTGCHQTNKRIYSICYELENGVFETVTVGENYKKRYNKPVVAILESSNLDKVYYVVIDGRGLPNIHGELEPPIYQKADGVVYFVD